MSDIDDENVDFEQYDFMADDTMDDDYTYDGGEEDDPEIAEFLNDINKGVMESKFVVKPRLQETISNTDIIAMFVDENFSNKKSNHLKMQQTNAGWALINYYTEIAGIVDNHFFLNKDKYSVTTSKIQSYIRRAASNEFPTTAYHEVGEQELLDVLRNGTSENSEYAKQARGLGPFDDDPMFQKVESKKKLTTRK